ncbi:MAG: YbaB/EbfC family nucleoid-associated protein [Chlamydiales bacterium]|nr:YbaB/EbfC family nucleoid-associated protein [Chlamydiales bacterium]
MGSGFAKKKKEAKRFREKMEEMQAQIKGATATGTAGGGLVSITLNGEHEMTKIAIKPECVDPEDVEGLEDLVRAAYKDACKQLEKETPDMGGFPGLPPGMGF